PTTTTAATPHSTDTRPSAASTTLRVNTASAAPTGYRGPLDIPALAAFTRRLRASSLLPVVSGVGISTPALAAQVAPRVDAVVIGTPVVRALVSAPEQAPPLIDHH
ncbi:hypothetical protein ACWEWQ_08950, partial [Streptomyces sp. NPDC003832]